MDRKKVFLATAIVVAVLLAVWAFWPAGEKWELGREYTFTYTLETNITIEGYRGTLPGRTFLLADSTSFNTPVRGPRGEQVLVWDQAMKPNTFKVFERQSPELKTRSLVFQKAYSYLEVRYNVAHLERQSVIPGIQPHNRPSPSPK